MEVLKNCPICKSKNFINFYKCKDYILSKEVFNIVKCNECNFLFTNPRPDEKNIKKYYKSDDYISHSRTKKGIINKLYHIVRKITLKQKYKIVREYVNNGKLLDFGCGTGEFLNYCKRRKIDCIGIEQDKDARDYAIKKYNIEVKDTNSFLIMQKKIFSCITLWHVLEHIHNLEEYINKFNTILLNNACLIIAVPNHNSLDAKIYKEYWAAYDLPRHLYHFTKKDIKKLFSENGFKLIKILAMKWDAYYISLLSEKYKNGTMLKGILYGFLSNLHALKNKEYSSLIYIFRKIS